MNKTRNAELRQRTGGQGYGGVSRRKDKRTGEEELEEGRAREERRGRKRTRGERKGRAGAGRRGRERSRGEGIGESRRIKSSKGKEEQKKRGRREGNKGK